MTTTAPREYWDQLYADAGLQYQPETLYFRDVFERFLPQGGDCFEVGCYPGRFLIYLGQTRGYRVSGIDTTPFVDTRLPAHIAGHGVEVGRLQRGDFLTMDAQPMYDVVCSFGFVEHFENYAQVIARHVDLVKPGGTLMITCPNFRWVNYVLRRTLDAQNLSRHVVASMNLRRWGKVLTGAGMELVHQGYYRTADFWYDPQEVTGWRAAAARRVVRWARAIDQRLSLPNRFTSPCLVSVSRKPPVE